MKRKKEDLSEEEYIESVDALYTAAGSLRGREAMKMFLKELLTPSERLMLGRRIQIAWYILQGENTSEIGRRLKVSRNTIWRVEKWLHDQMPGYEKAIEGLEKEMNKRTERRNVAADPLSFKALKKKYPLHFLLFADFSLKTKTKKKKK